VSEPIFLPSQLARERTEFRRAQSRRAATIAGSSTLLFFAVAITAVVLSPGWPKVHQSFLNWSIGRDSFKPIMIGMWLNLRILVVAEVVILVLGLAIAVCRTTRSPVLFPVRFLAAGYTDIFRGVPLLILLYVIGYGFPGLGMQGLPTSPVLLGSAAIVLTYSAYVAEVFRAGIESVHPSQRAAARSLGLTHAQTMRKVVLPQAIRRVVPPLMNDFVALQKDVGLVSILGVVDAIRSAQIIQSTDYNFTPYIVSGVVFVLLAIPGMRLADYLTLRAARRQSGSVVA
jgi:polar amino acid transport system permease protein